MCLFWHSKYDHSVSKVDGTFKTCKEIHFTSGRPWRDAHLGGCCDRRQATGLEEPPWPWRKTRCCNIFKVLAARLWILACLQLLPRLHSASQALHLHCLSRNSEEPCPFLDLSFKSPRPQRNRKNLSCVGRKLLASNARKGSQGVWVIARSLWDPVLAFLLLCFASQHWPWYTALPGYLVHMASG